MVVTELSALLRRLTAQHRITSSRCAKSSRRWTSTSTSSRSASARSCASRWRSTTRRSTCIVPSMILQPLVENCIKHGLSRKVGGGTHHHQARARATGALHRGQRRRARHVGGAAGHGARRTASASATSTSGCASSTARAATLQLHEQLGRGHARPARDSRIASPRSGPVPERLLCAPSSSTTSSSRGTSCATCSDEVGGVEVVARPATASRRWTPSAASQPDLVFLDVQMPGLTGFEVARRMLDGPRAARHSHFRDRLRPARDRGVRGQRGRLPAEADRRRRGSKPPSQRARRRRGRPARAAD